MMLARSVALVVGADSAIGAAIVRGLIARNAAKVYADAYVDCGDSLSPGAAPRVVDLAHQRRSGELARKLTDVNLLINCLVSGPFSDPSPGAEGVETLDQRSPTVGSVLKWIDALAPVLRDNGGGAVVNVLSVLHSEQPLGNTAPTSSRPFAEWLLAEGLRDRLAAQQTQLLFLGTQLVVGQGEQVLEDQRALAGHIAMRLLTQIEAGHRPDDGVAFGRYQDPFFPDRRETTK